MSAVMNTPQGVEQETAFKKWWRSRNFVQQRMLRFGLSMLAMIVCFPLYYLGLFGGVDGPLNPGRIGDSLAAMGVTRTHSMVVFLSFLIIALSWNWLYNLVSLMVGSRLTCTRKIDDRGTLCGQRVRRTARVHKKTGQAVTQYVCPHGHKRPEAHFHPVKKGSVSHSVWATALAFCVIVFFMS